MIILNEKEAAMKIIDNDCLGDSTSEDLVLLAKYYKKEGIHAKDIKNKLNMFITKSIPSVNISKWDKTVDYAINCAKKYPLLELNSIAITESEINIIKGIDGVTAQRLMFTLLCLAKVGNAKSDRNSGWVNRDEGEIFRLANIQRSPREKEMIINMLWKAGYIGYSNLVDNININVKIVDDSSVPVMYVHDFRNLGYQYTNHINGGFFECSMCGIMVKKISNNQKYCKSCSEKIIQQKKHESYIKRYYKN